VEGFAHLLLPYDGAESFLAGVVPFVREGLEDGERVVVVTGVANQELLRMALGDDVRGVAFAEAREFYRHPLRTLAEGLARADAAKREGRRLRLVGEPVWKGRSPLEVTEWVRMEALVNVACERRPAAVLCPYSTLLPAAIVAGARRTHPETVKGVRRLANPGYVDPWRVCEQLDAEPLPEAPEDVEVLRIEKPDLYWLRAYVGDYARSMGMGDEVLQRLLVAVTEVVTNAVRHGAPPVELRLWREPGQLVCEVSDSGTWGGGGFGYLPPDPAEPGRLGLWAVRLLCSAVQIRAGEAGTTVRLRVPEPGG
jgi:MEDS: MEthanogen/methylotroph, DcmR Sensory domain/Histidine kinase-like ATPase domain